MSETDHATQIILTDARLPTDHFILEGLDVTREPIFTVSEVAKVFFARSPHWIRWRERKGDFILDGHEVVGNRTEGGARRYNLDDIERMAHALAERGSLTQGQLTNTLVMVQTQAKLWGYVQ